MHRSYLYIVPSLVSLFALGACGEDSGNSSDDQTLGEGSSSSTVPSNSGAGGMADPTGTGTNGSGTNGSGTNGSGTNGSTVASGTNGGAADDSSASVGATDDGSSGSSADDTGGPAVPGGMGGGGNSMADDSAAGTDDATGTDDTAATDDTASTDDTAATDDTASTDDTGVMDDGATDDTTVDDGAVTDDGAADDMGGDEGPDVDEMGKANAVPGESTDTPQDYLRLGEIRILNNNWGSEDLGCFAPNSTMAVFVDNDSRFGWDFSRGDCAGEGDGSHPDFPQVEFGIHPFGIGSHLETSPPFSSTTLLPIQLGQVQSASISVQDMRIELQNESSWNITMEFWLSERDPREPDPGVYAEIMAFWGWQGGRWPSAPGADGSAEGGSGTGDNVSAGDKSYTLWVQRDNWADGWRYFQFRADDGPQRNYGGTIDIKPFIDYLKQRGYADSLWVTRLEVGSEIDDNTSGRVSMSGITFEVNGESRSAELGN